MPSWERNGGSLNQKKEAQCLLKNCNDYEKTYKENKALIHNQVCVKCNKDYQLVKNGIKCVNVKENYARYGNCKVLELSALDQAPTCTECLDKYFSVSLLEDGTTT